MNIYLFYGNEETLIKDQISKIINENNIPSDSINEYSLQEADLLDIIDDANTIGMFSPKNALIINDSELLWDTKKLENMDALEKYLQSSNPDTLIFFKSNSEKIDSRKKIIKELSKMNAIKEFNKEAIKDIKKYCQDYLTKENYKISPSDFEYLLKRLGNNIDLIINELDKLMLYKLEDKTITKKDIDVLTEPNIEEEIFSLTDAVIKDNVPKSIELYKYFLANNYDTLQIIALLANQFRFLFQVKRLSNKGLKEADIIKELGVHPYRVKLAIETNYNYRETDYLKYLFKLATLDENIKKGQIDKDLFLELFLLNKDIDILMLK